MHAGVDLVGAGTKVGGPNTKRAATELIGS